MITNNLLAEKYNKKYALPVYSGTLAIEGILKSLSLCKDDKVLISSYSCYSILEAIINANLKPIIVIPNEGITLSETELKTVIKKEEIKVYIAIHQYGYYQVVPKIKDIVIIEDFSQAWNLEVENYKIGYNSDYLISSFGKTKPLSNGIGGIILSNNDIGKYFDLKTKNDRYKQNKLIEYYYPNPINYKKLISFANKKVSKQRINAVLFDNVFKKYDFVNLVRTNGYIPSYHRYLIQVNDLDKICSIMEKSNILFQKEYKIPLHQLPIIKNENIKVIGKQNKLRYLLLMTNNKKINIKRFDKEMEKEYGKKS